jgi:hypothetical protein
VLSWRWGSGANNAIFELVNALRLRAPLPYYMLSHLAFGAPLRFAIVVRSIFATERLAWKQNAEMVKGTPMW